MSDEADKGNEAAELFLLAALSKSQRTPPAPTGDGLCINCGVLCETINHRWCSLECREDYVKYGGLK
jgi:hypothetical protein